VGGLQGTLSIQFRDAIYKVFSDPPEAMMVKQSGFAGGAVAAQFPELVYGVDYDFFGVPDIQGVQGGASWMMAFSDKPAVQAVVAYLSSDLGGQKWAEVGFDLTPNMAGNGFYTDPALLKKGDLMANAEDFTPDIGDSIPSGFGNAEWRAIIDYLNGGNLDAILARTAEVQAAGVAGLPAVAMPTIDCMGAQPGDELTMMYQWSGVEEENLNKVLQPLFDACGFTVVPESSRDQGLLDTRVQAGTPPDLVFWTIRHALQYQDSLVALTDLGVQSDNYASYWSDQGTFNGRWLALPVKADPKSLVWYSPVTFDAYGYEVPATWAELEALVEQMVADGNVPWSMGFESGDATGWTGSDFIQDVLQVKQGYGYVHDIINGSVPYDDAGVKEAYEIYKKWAVDPISTPWVVCRARSRSNSETPSTKCSPIRQKP
jgi:hypothetical protein